MTNVELYEALKGSIPDKAARLIAEAFPQARDLATTRDLESTKSALSSEIAEFRTYFTREVGRLETRMEALHSSTLRWMLGLFVPIWAATWGTLLAALLRG